MLAFLVLITFLFGITCGIIGTVSLAITMDARDDRKMRKAVQKETAARVGPNPFVPNILS